MQVCTCCGVACGKCLANEGLLEESSRLRAERDALANALRMTTSKDFVEHVLREVRKTNAC